MSVLHEPLAQIGKLTINGWKIIGWSGALMFTGRWIVQLIASKRHKRPTFPLLYWWMSVAGALMTLSYFVWGKNDSVGILQNLFPAFVASYNLYLELSHRRGQESPPA